MLRNGVLDLDSRVDFEEVEVTALAEESVRAESTITGALNQPRNPPSTSMPDMSGKPRSRITTSGRNSAAARNASVPLVTVTTGAAKKNIRIYSL